MKNFFKLDKPTFSFEIFPPKGAGDLSQIFATVDALASLDPDLISVTYGAGGSTRDRTRDLVVSANADRNYPVMAHLTCVGHTRSELAELLEDYAAMLETLSERTMTECHRLTERRGHEILRGVRQPHDVVVTAI